jgi:hypothetical protein
VGRNGRAAYAPVLAITPHSSGPHPDVSCSSTQSSSSQDNAHPAAIREHHLDVAHAPSAAHHIHRDEARAGFLGHGAPRSATRTRAPELHAPPVQSPWREPALGGEGAQALTAPLLLRQELLVVRFTASNWLTPLNTMRGINSERARSLPIVRDRLVPPRGKCAGNASDSRWPPIPTGTAVRSVRRGPDPGRFCAPSSACSPSAATSSRGGAQTWADARSPVERSPAERSGGRPVPRDGAASSFEMPE